MSVAAAIEKIRLAGFTVEADGDNIAIDPFDELSDRQLTWLRAHKSEVLAELRATRSSGSVLEAGQAGNDVEAANDRVIVHVPEFTAASGRRVSFDLDVPVANLPLLRRSLRFQLRNGHGGSLLGSPGATEAELMELLIEKYGARLAEIKSPTGQQLLEVLP